MLRPKRNDDDISLFILSLLKLPGIGTKTVRKILSEHKTEIFGAERLDADFAETLNDQRLVKALEKAELTWEEAEREAFETLDHCRNNGVAVLNQFSIGYPSRLLRNENFPPLLFCKGDASLLNQDKSVAIVGTRNPTEFGARMGLRLAELLAEDGYVIVSGLALGCDSLGHEGALAASGKTVAVLPTPVDAPVYPRKNQDLANRILESGGALVSEYVPGIELNERQLVSNLVARDEWQPALADGIIAIETSRSGGTRHALQHAKKTNTPIAVFDYSKRASVDFFNDERFGGNVDYLASGASPIFEAQTIEDFKRRMDDYRNGAMRDGSSIANRGEESCQTRLDFDC